MGQKRITPKRSSRALTARTRKFLQRSANRIAKVRAKGEARMAKLQSNASRGGLAGKIARDRLVKMEKMNSQIRIEQQKPKVFGAARAAEIKTEAATKKAKAYGTAAAGVASALGGSYSAGKVADSKQAIEKAKAEIETSKALVASLGQVRSVPETDSNSVSGLVTGVR